MPKGLPISRFSGIDEKTQGATKSAHQTFPDAFFQAPKTKNPIWYVVKKNKHPSNEGLLHNNKRNRGEEASCLEAAFTELARLYSSGIIPKQRIILNDKNPNSSVFGIASENFSHHIEQLIQKGNKCYSFSEQNGNWNYTPIPTLYNTSQEKPGLYKMSQRLPTSEELSSCTQSQYFLTNKELAYYYYNPKEPSEGRLLPIPVTEKQLRTINQLLVQENKEVNHINQLDKNRLETIESIIGHTLLKTGYKFLDTMPPNFFAQLMQKHVEGEIIIDMESLAFVLSIAYTLEEDDLHKGNIGFYVTDEWDTKTNKNKKKFIFFKIDHDLMFADSIMSRKDPRINNYFYGKNAYSIRQQDLLQFPKVTHTQPHYWPTIKRWFVKLEKAYHNFIERDAFARLKDVLEFQQAKWKSFLKYILLPPELIEYALTQHLDPNDKQDAAQIRMIKTAITMRRRQLRQVLLKIPEFQNYLSNGEGSKALAEIKEELKKYINDPTDKTIKKNNPLPYDWIKEQIQDTFDVLQEQAKSPISKSSKAINKNPPSDEEFDNQLNKIIAFGDYTFSSKIKLISPKRRQDIINKVHAKFDDLKTSLEHANSDIKIKKINTEIFKHACMIMHLDAQNGQPQINIDPNIINKANIFWKNYLDYNKITSYDTLKKRAVLINDAPLPIKQQKMEFKKLLEKVLKDDKLGKEDLELLKYALTNIESDHDIKFLQQLRSNSWFVRSIFGTYGHTTTCSEMIKKIDEKLLQLDKSKKSGQSKMKTELENINKPSVGVVGT